MTSIFTAKTIKETPLYIDSLYAYLLCQLHGDNPACRRFQEDYYEYQSPNITSAIFIMMGLINWVNLLFVVQYQDIKQITTKIVNIFHCSYRVPTTECTSNDNSKNLHVTNSTANI